MATLGNPYRSFSKDYWWHWISIRCPRIVFRSSRRYSIEWRNDIFWREHIYSFSPHLSRRFDRTTTERLSSLKVPFLIIFWMHRFQSLRSRRIRTCSSGNRHAWRWLCLRRKLLFRAFLRWWLWIVPLRFWLWGRTLPFWIIASESSFRHWFRKSWWVILQRVTPCNYWYWWYPVHRKERSFLYYKYGSRDSDRCSS